MYLLAQIWSLLLLAFVLGLVFGFVVWRSCGRADLAAVYERQCKDLKRRLASAELERDRFSGAALEAEGEIARLRAAMSGANAAGPRASGGAAGSLTP